MGVPLLDSLNYIIFHVSTLPLPNSLQTPPEVPHNQRESAWILSKRVENIGDISLQSRHCYQSVCVTLVLYIAPEEIVQRTKIRAVRKPAPAPLSCEQKTVRNDTLLEVSFNQIQGQISSVCHSSILLKPKFRKFFHHSELGEALFFQYLKINRAINIFLNENRTNKPLHAEHYPYVDFLWMQVLC